MRRRSNNGFTEESEEIIALMELTDGNVPSMLYICYQLICRRFENAQNCKVDICLTLSVYMIYYETANNIQMPHPICECFSFRWNDLFRLKKKKLIISGRMWKLAPHFYFIFASLKARPILRIPRQSFFKLSHYIVGYFIFNMNISMRQITIFNFAAD